MKIKIFRAEAQSRGEKFKFKSLFFNSTAPPRLRAGSLHFFPAIRSAGIITHASAFPNHLCRRAATNL